MHSAAPPAPGLTAYAAPPQASRAIVCCFWHVQPAGTHAELAGSIHANAYACFNLVLRGRVRIGTASSWLPQAFVTGPLTRPLHTVHSMPLVSLSIVVQPWLLAAWFGIAPASLVDGALDLAAVEPGAAWLERIAPLLSMADDRVACMHRIAATVPHAGCAAERYATLMWEAGRVAAAAQRAGISERHFHREFVRNYGLAPKRWLQLRRFEHSLVHLARGEPAGGSLAQAALDTGFNDQSQMHRAFQACSATTPRAVQARLHNGLPGCTSLDTARLFGTAEPDPPPR